MPETQNTEYKSSWQDDYLKWICGFANAQGGTLIIGKDDNGETWLKKQGERGQGTIYVMKWNELIGS